MRAIPRSQSFWTGLDCTEVIRLHPGRKAGRGVESSQHTADAWALQGGVTVVSRRQACGGGGGGGGGSHANFNRASDLALRPRKLTRRAGRNAAPRNAQACARTKRVALVIARR